MDILLRVGKLMVMAVVGGPPKRSLLAGGSPPESQYELEKPAGLVGAVGKITVVSAGDGEHPGIVHENTHGDGGPTDAGQEGQDTHHMYQQEWDSPLPIHFLAT